MSQGWTGGNDPKRATPPWNNKGLIDQWGPYKSAFWVVRGIFSHTKPLTRP